MAFSFKELREKINPKGVIVKKYRLEDKEIVITKDDISYSVSVDGENLYDEFDNQVEAEEAVNEFLELLTGE
jgi:hypothetical protein